MRNTKTKSRREFLTSSGSVLGASMLALNMPLILTACERAQTQLQSGAAYENITLEQAVELGAIADQIIPEDETPGATQTGVVYFMDTAFGGFMAGALPMLTQGLDDLQKKARSADARVERFSELSFDQQTTFPVPLLPVKSSGVLFEQGARAIGLHPQPAPMAILSKPHNGRPACLHCGFCMGFGCEANAKSSALASMIPQAEASGRCEIRPLSTVFRIETNNQGRVTEVVYLDAAGQEQAQKARAVILSANGAETPRLLFLSESGRSPDGLANSSGIVGKYLMGNAHTTTQAAFEQPLVDKFHRAHDVPNLFICDGSSFVSSGRGQPTMTIQALAFRAAEHIANFARRGEI